MKENKLVLASGIIAIALLGAAILIFLTPLMTVFGNVTGNQPAQVDNFQTYRFFSTSTVQTVFATSTSATSTDITAWFDSTGQKDSGYFVVAGAKKVQFYFTYDGVTTTPTGTAGFTVEASPDGSSWYDVNKLVLSTSTTKTTVSEIYTSGPTTTVPASLDIQDDAWYAVRCIARHAVTTKQTGEFKCSATAEF